jgi:hypothetical protein
MADEIAKKAPGCESLRGRLAVKARLQSQYPSRLRKYLLDVGIDSELVGGNIGSIVEAFVFHW